MASAVAVIGLGRMGGPMADHVARAGHPTRVYDVAPDALSARVAAGAVAASSPGEAARGVDVVCVVVFDDEQVCDVVTGPDGVLRTLAPGAVVAIHSTVTVDTIRALAEAAEPRGVAVLDVGISGGEAAAHAGTLLCLAGGADDAVARARPVLLAFSRDVLHAGPLGAGMALKLARNAVGYSWMVAVREATELATRAGVDAAMLRRVVTETGTFEQSFLLEELDADGRAHLARLADKDLDHALGLAAASGAPVRALDATRRAFPDAAGR